MKEFIITKPLMTFEDWMRDVMEFEEGTISSRLSNLKTLETYFGPLINQWKKDKFASLLQLLAFSRDDEKNNRQPQVNLPIKGSIYDGLATYRSVLRLYARYLSFAYCPTARYHFGDIGLQVDDAIGTIRRRYENDTHKKDSYTSSEVKNLIVAPLINELRARLKDYEFNSEKVTIEPGVSDRYDILGENPTDDSLPVIIIEVDTHRSDQVTKKMVSRIALNASRKVLYISLVYPNNHNQKEAEEKECMKYFGNIHTIFSLFAPPAKCYGCYTIY